MSETTVKKDEVVHRADRIALIVLGAITALLALLILAQGVNAALQTLLQPDRTRLQLLVEGDVPHELSGDAAAIVSARYEAASVVATGLSDGARWLLAAGDLAGAVTGGVVTGALAFLFFQIGRGRTFHRLFPAIAITTGAVLTVGTLLSQFIRGFGVMQTVSELDPEAVGPFWMGFEFEPLPWLIGFAIIALAVVFIVGRRLERDTKGLV